MTYAKTLDFLSALEQWSGKPFDEFPADKAPCGFLAGLSDDENRILAHTFALLCSEPLNREVTGKIAFLAGTVMVHQRRLQMVWDRTFGVRDPRKVGSMDRSQWSRMRPYEEMIEALQMWLEELHQKCASTVEVTWLDQIARVS